MNQHIQHRVIKINGISTFYREAGPSEAPVLLLPHGYPCSSFQYRNLMLKLGHKWRLIAPDFPGFGYSDTPENFDYSFDGYADFLDQFIRAMSIDKFCIYLHDYGSQIGFRLAMKDPERVQGLIIQNGDIYEDALGPKYDGLKDYWANPTEQGRKKLENAVSEEGFRDEFIGEIDKKLHDRLPPDLWKLGAALLLTPKRREIMVGLIEGLKENLTWMPECQTYLREHQPATLIVWGPQDGYMPEKSARAYLRDLPSAKLHLLEGGHWLLETHLDEVSEIVDDFLTQLEGSTPSLQP